MSSTPQSANPAILDSPAKPLMRKYDKRKGNTFVRSAKTPGRKPIWQKHLARNTAAKLFSELNVKERLAQMIDSKDERLAFEVIRYVWDRLEGKPFTAENPALKPQPPAQDNRLQVAIQNLIVPAMDKPKKTKKVKALPEVIDAEPAK